MVQPLSRSLIKAIGILSLYTGNQNLQQEILAHKGQLMRVRM